MWKGFGGPEQLKRNVSRFQGASIKSCFLKLFLVFPSCTSLLSPVGWDVVKNIRSTENSVRPTTAGEEHLDPKWLYPGKPQGWMKFGSISLEFVSVKKVLVNCVAQFMIV